MGIRTVVAHSTADAALAARARSPTSRSASGRREPRASYLNIPEHHLGRRPSPTARRSTPATASSRRTPPSRRSAAPAASPSSGRRPRPSASWATRRRRARWPRQAGVPVVPGSEGPLDGVDEAQALADAIGYPGHGQGRGRRRRPRHAHRARARVRCARAFATCQAEAQRRLRLLRALPREVRRGGAARRGAGAGRPERHPRPPGRARLLRPAAPPEAARGVARARPSPPETRAGLLQGRARRRQRRQLRQRGHGGVPRRRATAASTSSR